MRSSSLRADRWASGARAMCTSSTPFRTPRTAKWTAPSLWHESWRVAARTLAADWPQGTLTATDRRRVLEIRDIVPPSARLDAEAEPLRRAVRAFLSGERA